jgi:hypothetical protein
VSRAEQNPSWVASILVPPTEVAAASYKTPGNQTDQKAENSFKFQTKTQEPSSTFLKSAPRPPINRAMASPTAVADDPSIGHLSSTQDEDDDASEVASLTDLCNVSVLH